MKQSPSYTGVGVVHSYLLLVTSVAGLVLAGARRVWVKGLADILHLLRLGIKLPSGKHTAVLLAAGVA